MTTTTRNDDRKNTTTNSEPGTTNWTIDAGHSSVEFTAKHMMITTVKGHLSGVEGNIAIDWADPARSTVDVKLDAASVDTRSGQRDEHLRSAEFLDAGKYPAITFRSRRIEGAKAESDARFRVIGDLTIRGVEREVVLNASYEGRGKDPWGGERVSFAATTTIDRREFGLVWNQALEAGGVLVSNEIKLNLEIQAIQPA